MNDPLERTKVVLRHLPPSLTELALTEQIDCKFYGRYKCFCFRPGKNSQKNQRHTRAYIDFRSPVDVFEFAEFFDGHVFVNEKGTQFKVLVEYAPSQCVPKPWTKKDGREGTIFKDPDYLEFLELLAKPAENLPSAEIQLERREAEKDGAAKEASIVTPLMDFVRQKRAAKSGSQRTSSNGRISRRAALTGSFKRNSDKRGGHALMHVSRDSTKNESGKENPTYILMPRRNEQLIEKYTEPPSASGKGDTQDETGTDTIGSASGVPTAVEAAKKAILLLKGKKREGSHPHAGCFTINQKLKGSAAFKQIQRLEAPRRIIRSILSSKEGRQVTPQSDSKLITVKIEKDKRPPRPHGLPANSKEHWSGLLSRFDADGKSHTNEQADSNESNTLVVNFDNKYDKRLRNKDRPDRGAWAPFHRSDGSHGRGIDSPSTNDMPVGHGEIKHNTPSGFRSSESKSLGHGRGCHTLENGVHRHAGRRGPVHGLKELDNSAKTMEGKPSQRGPHEKQVWVQKFGSAS